MEITPRLMVNLTVTGFLAALLLAAILPSGMDRCLAGHSAAVCQHALLP